MDKTFFESFRKDDYQRDSFDNFLKSIKFSYSIPSIHIAGTNGKTSTSVYLAHAYIGAGYKVGLFTSPYLYNPNEEIRINGQCISDDDFMSIFNKYKKEVNKYDLSSFEIMTIVALSYFQEQKCDIAIIECGMGGEIDATNIIEPVLSIITSISLEHTDFLGYTISEITAQKAGIIKENVPVLIPDLSEDAMTVIYEVAKINNSKICYLGHYVHDEYSGDGYSFEYGEFGRIQIPSVAKYSIQNCVIALEALCVLKERFPFASEKVVSELRNAFIPCQCEVVNKNPLVIIDGAHNPEGMKKFCDISLLQITGNKPIHVLFACCKDKNLGGLLSVIGETTNDLTITTFNSPRARGEEEFFLFAGDYQFESDAKELLKNKMSEFPDDCFIITGSEIFAAEMREMFIK